ncbi:MAG: hypothetical protein ACI9YL_001914, partial [Luteibaculaceae bacterium]
RNETIYTRVGCNPSRNETVHIRNSYITLSGLRITAYPDARLK